MEFTMDGGSEVAKYQSYLRLIFELLDHQDFIVGDIEELQQVFVENFRKMVVATLDMSFDADTFEKLYYEFRRDGELEENRILQACVQMVENKETYVVLNSYLEAFLRSYLKNCRAESRGEVWGVVGGFAEINC